MSTLRATNIKNPDSGSNNIVLSEGGGVVISGVTTSSSFVGNVTGNATGLSGTPNLNVGVVTATSFVGNGSGLTGVGGASGNRNLIINGAMSIAQRGTSSTSGGYQTVDRYSTDDSSGTVTKTQESLSSGDPYDQGFRKFLRLTNTSAVSDTAAGYRNIYQVIEAQNAAQSGWNYISTSSYITLSFWVRSSISQEYYGSIQTADGTTQKYPFSTGTLAANTWTKITKTIPGNSNITIDNNNGSGLIINISPFWGTNYTDPGVSVDTWASYSGSTRFPDYTSTWGTTAGATFDITGVQLEVGSSATTFEHRSYGDELARCQRYYYKAQATGGGSSWGMGYVQTTTQARFIQKFPVEMRVRPTALEQSGTAGDYRVYYQFTSTTCSSVPAYFYADTWEAQTNFIVSSGLTVGEGAIARAVNSNAYLAWSAEL